MSSSAQFTPAQVLNAARRAEAEGKLDYAAQFYRHIVDYLAASPEAQDAREGLGRLEWRRKEPPAPPRPWPAASPAPPSLNGANGGAPLPPLASYAPRHEAGYPRAPIPTGSSSVVRNGGHHAHLPPSLTEAPAAPDADPIEDPPVAEGYRTGRFMAGVIGIIGWAGLLGGALMLVVVLTLAPAGLSARVFGLPLGILAGFGTIVLGVVLVLASQLAHAVFDSASATRSLVSIEKTKALL